MQKSIKAIEVKGAPMKMVSPAIGVPDVVWGVVKNHLVVTLSLPAAEAVINLLNGNGGPTLAADAQFAKVLAKTGGGMACLYADVARFRKTVLPMILAQKVKDADQIAEINKAIGAFGGEAIDAIGFGLRPDGNEFVSQAYVLAPRGKPGILVLADQKPVSSELLATVPADATFAVLLSVNRVKVITELETQLAKFPEAKAKFDEFRKGLEDAIGLNLKTDLAPAIGDGMAIYNSPAAGGFLFTGLTIVAEVRDAAKVRAALPKLEAAMLAQLPKLLKDMKFKDLPKLGGEGMKMDFKTGKFKGYEYRYLSTAGVPMPIAPAWCVTDKYVVFSMFPQTLKAALLKIESGRDGSLLANESLAKQLAGPAKGASALCYVNSQQIVKIVYPVLLPLWQVGCSYAGQVGLQLDVNALPRQDQLVKAIGDSYGAVVPDAEGVLLIGRGAMPLVGAAATVAPALMWLGMSKGRASGPMPMAKPMPMAIPAPAPGPQEGL